MVPGGSGFFGPVRDRFIAEAATSDESTSGASSLLRCDEWSEPVLHGRARSAIIAGHVGGQSKTFEGASDTAPTAVTGRPGAAAVHERPRIGRYAVLGSLGQGAMGHVLRAYDPKLRREVALKLVYAGVEDEARAQVVREAQAMAQLSHPHIVAVYDVEVVDDQPFIAMEYVEGQTLKAWTRAATRSIPEVLDVYRQAGRGLAAAHAAGLTHRDFKPANVMLREDGRAQVMDFGIAHDVHDADFSAVDGVADEGDSMTATGVIVGTPAYMAPEQHEGGRADARSDQFAFCVSLWEALCSHRPFAGPDFAAAKRSQVIDSPAGARAIPGVLREPLRRGMSPEPADRFASMQQLLAALEVDPGRRRRRLTVAAAAAAVSLALGGWWWTDRRARQQRCEDAVASIDEAYGDATKTQIVEAFAATGERGADHAAGKTTSWLDDYVFAWRDAQRALCRAVEIDRRPPPAAAQAQRCLSDRRDEVRALANALVEADAHVVRSAVRAAMRLPTIASCEDEVWLRTRPVPPDDPQLVEQLAALRRDRRAVSAMLSAGRVREATTRATEVAAQARKLGWTPETAEALVDLAELLEKTGDYKGARDAAVEAFQLSIAAGHDVGALSAATRLIFVVGYGLSHHTQALQWSATGTALGERMGFAPDHPRMTALLNNTGVVLHAKGDYEAARQTHEKALAIKRRSLGDAHLSVSHSLANLGIVQATTGDRDGARASFEEALSITRDAFGDEHLAVAGVYSKLGTIAHDAGDYDRALDELGHALRIKERILGPNHSDIGIILNNIGLTHIDRGAPADALQPLTRALRIAEGDERGDHPVVASTLTNLAKVRILEGDRVRAIALLRRALKIQVAQLGETHPDTRATRLMLGELAAPTDRPQSPE